MWRLLAWASTIGVAVLCLVPGPDLPEAPVMSHDKVLHALAFFVVGFAWRRSNLAWHRSLLVGLALAAGTELGQAYLVPGRHGDWIDFAADTVGLILGILALPRRTSAHAR